MQVVQDEHIATLHLGGALHKLLIVKTLLDIAPGDEFLMDYGDLFWDSCTEGPLGPHTRPHFHTMCSLNPSLLPLPPPNTNILTPPA